MEFLFCRYKATILIVIAAVFAAASLLPSTVVAADGEGLEHPEYTLIERSYQYRFRLHPIGPEDDVDLIARTVPGDCE